MPLLLGSLQHSARGVRRAVCSSLAVQSVHSSREDFPHWAQHGTLRNGSTLREALSGGLRPARWSGTAPAKLDSEPTFISEFQAVYVLEGCRKLGWLCGELCALPEAVLQQWAMVGA